MKSKLFKYKNDFDYELMLLYYSKYMSKPGITYTTNDNRKTVLIFYENVQQGRFIELPAVLCFSF